MTTDHPPPAQAQQVPPWSRQRVNLDSLVSDNGTPNVLGDCDPDLFDTLLDFKTESDECAPRPNGRANANRPSSPTPSAPQRPSSAPSRKPSRALLPPNALCLHLADGPVPAPHMHDPPHTPPPPPDPSGPAPPARPRVHFRSRVRITSGIGRQHRRSQPDIRGIDSSDFYPSSRSGSPSSSISAPLRSPTDEDTSPWGTLGQRVGLMALQKKIKGASPQRRRHLPIPPSRRHNEYRHRHALSADDGDAEQVDERTPLRGSFRRSVAYAYAEGEGVREDDILDDDSDDERLSAEIDEVFGKFPGRLLNHHYWWFQLEPILCCNYAAE
ncbi:hypothetical protein FIBSPDRAFT_867488 [Athelia psychrophila]|uniref:Uncharacterized protein n=1 Tax=Athelia psychrophila TaxID=1759441 RepID=A0A166DYM4_9AGAM|nr:hypothetical protein FIBSPDRAFT_867488 [Fibularhizoctonia sp. CBS 109695]